MLLGLEEKQHNEEEEAATDAKESVELDDEQGASLECSTSTEVSTNSGKRSRTRAPDDDSFDSESISSGFERAGPPMQKTALSPAVAAFVPRFSRPPPSKWDDAQKWISSPTSNRAGRAGAGGGTGPKKSALAGNLARPPPVAKVFVEVPVEAKKEGGGLKAGVLVNNAVGLVQHDSVKPVDGASVINTLAPAVRSVSMRDMGTEMTPIASQEPSRTGTPVIASTLCSPTSSRTPTPQRTATNSAAVGLANCVNCDSNEDKMSDEEPQMKTRREIVALGQQLGKTNIAAWASKEEEEMNANFANAMLDQTMQIDQETRAADWEEAEKAKYLARLEREGVKIQAWENHQKAKIEAEMKKIEAEIERKRAREHERLTNKLTAARHRAEEKRAAAEARRNQEAARAAQQAEQIRRTGRIPSSFSCWCWCL